MRQFDFDPVERVLANRGEYIAAALTICRAYIVAGRPIRLRDWHHSRGEWSDTVRSALMWLGQEDAVKSMENARAEDPERVELSDMLRVLGVRHRYRPRKPDEACCRAAEGPQPDQAA